MIIAPPKLENDHPDRAFSCEKAPLFIVAPPTGCNGASVLQVRPATRFGTVFLPMVSLSFIVGGQRGKASRVPTHYTVFRPSPDIPRI